MFMEVYQNGFLFFHGFVTAYWLLNLRRIAAFVKFVIIGHVLQQLPIAIRFNSAFYVSKSFHMTLGLLK